MSDQERIRGALSFIAPDDRETWVRMGMAIKSELGDAGFDLWDAWSQQAESYHTRDARDVWKSIKAGGKVTVGTLFHEAKLNGWQDDGTRHQPTPEEVAERKRKGAEMAAQEAAQTERERADTAAKAATIWQVARPATSFHPYLLRKGVAPVATLREVDALTASAILGYHPKSGDQALTWQLVVVPVKRGDTLSTLELIDGDGNKAALAGRGTKTGGYWATDNLPATVGALLVGEGVATVLSASHAVNRLGIAALSSGNLVTVAKAMRERYPAADLVILADLVKATGEADPHAVEAAQSVDGRLAVPDFGPNRAANMTDFNDLAQSLGVEAVERAITGGKVPEVHYATEVTLTCASDVKPEAIDWLWPGWLAAGKMQILGGAPGTGKTTIAMALAAAVTTGGTWPDGTRAPVGNAVIWSGEDDPADTLVPRLIKAGADLSRVFFVGDIREGKDRRSFDPSRDIAPLRRKLVEVGEARLLIVDPIVSAVAGDSHKNAEVRRGLQPLVDMVASMRCALLGNTHFTKGTTGRDPVERITGSLAFGALARVVLVAAKHQEQGEDGKSDRVLMRAKSNIGPDDGGFTYDLHQGELEEHPGIVASHVVWLGEVAGQARDILATADASGDDGGGSLASAKHFLGELLAHGGVPAKQVQKEAIEAGYSWSTIRRAQTALGIKPTKGGMKQGWHWYLPPPNMLNDTEDARHNVLGAFGEDEHLQGDSGTEWEEI